MSLQSRLIVLTAVLASLLEIIDTSIVNVAIPTMMGNLGSTLEDISWVVTGYIIANAIVLPISGWLGMRIGRRVYFTSCILLFTATSVACGFAPNLVTLTIFRVFQGLAGGALLPTSQTLIYEQFPGEKAGMGGAIFGMSVMIGPTLGPTMGGYLTDHFGWRMIFNINLPLGLLAALMAWTNIEDSKPIVNTTGVKPKIDIVGLLLLIIGIGTLQYVLERGQADDWFDSIAIRLCALSAVISIPAFIWWELKVPNPIVKVALFKQSVVRNGTMLMTILGFFLYGIVFVIPIFTGRVLHYDATQTGLTFIPGALLTAFMMPFIGKALAKIDARVLIGLGFLFVEMCLYSFTRYSSLSDDRQLFWSLILRGIAMAFLFVPINTVVLGSFKGPDLGQVSGLMNLLRQLGGSVGIAMIGTLLDRFNQQNYLDLASHVSMLSPATASAVSQGSAGMTGRMASQVGLAAPMAASLRSIAYRMENQVFLMSFTQLMWVIFIVAISVVIPLSMLKKPKPGAAVTDVH